MIPGLHVTTLLLGIVSGAVSGWVGWRCYRLYRADRELVALGSLAPLAAFSIFFAAGVAVIAVPQSFYVGEVLILVVGVFSPMIWAFFGYRVVVEAGGAPPRTPRLFGLAALGAIATIVFLLISRPDISEGAWYIEENERWLFFMLLILGAWAVSYFERAFRWSTDRLRKKLLWPRMWLAALFTLWVLITGEGFIWARIHDYWLGPIAIAQAGSILALYLFFRFRADEDVPFSFSRRAAYSSAIVVILGAYLIFMGLVGMLIRWAGGDVETYLSILAAFLAVLLLSLLIALPSVGRRVRRFIDRHLYKSRIDFAAEWAKVTENISGILELPTLVKTVAGFMQDTFSDRVYIFLPAPGGGQYTLYYPFGHDFPHVLPIKGEAADWLWRLGEPVFIGNWKTQVSDRRELEFLSFLEQSFEGRIIVPLLARRNMLGFAVLGPRRDRPDYDDEDFEFLSALAGPVAFAVLTGQVSEELVARREMESFNRLSTFVAHDLKNSVSMLSMLLQNAQKHMDDPAFQESALRTITDAVGRMQNLIAKISAEKDRLPPESKPIDLNKMIEEIAAQTRLDVDSRITYRFNPGQIPPAVGDPMNIRRILENLIVNAMEAMPDGGELEVSTGTQNGAATPWVWVRVRDTGAGMTREFISTRLFKLFESTKKKGLGIGMYQVKQMVEADGGRIQVYSEPDKGTTFEVSWCSQNREDGRNLQAKTAGE